MGYIKHSKLLGEYHDMYSIVYTHIKFSDSSKWWIILYPKNEYKDMYFILAENLRLYDTDEEVIKNDAIMQYDRCARINMTKPEYVECDIPNWILNEEEKAFLVHVLNTQYIWEGIIKSWDFEMQTQSPHELFPIPDYMQLP